MISEAAHEVLEKYWSENKENGQPWSARACSHHEVAAELIKGDYAEAKGGAEGILELTDKGWEEARHCVRRHRLAERLLADVLAVREGSIHEASCRFEHVLHSDVEANICALLGHPSSCPHGKPIPEGKCCRSERTQPRKLVLPLSECVPGDRGKIAFVRSHDGGAMDKLTVMGVLPGLSVTLLRTSPSFLFQLGESQFAIDKKLAGRIHIRLGARVGPA